MTKAEKILQYLEAVAEAQQVQMIQNYLDAVAEARK